MNHYKPEEIEEIESLIAEASDYGISLESAIKDGEPIAILRQIIEETEADSKNYSYGM